MEMNEWQPARMTPAHGVAPRAQEKVDFLKSRVIRIRPAKISKWALLWHRSVGCNAEKFFEVHPDDNPPFKKTILFFCEHEILTD